MRSAAPDRGPHAPWPGAPSWGRGTRTIPLGQVAGGLAVLLAVVVHAASDTYVVDRICYDGTLVAAGVAAWVGAERGPRAARTVPRLVALGVSLSALGDLLWDLLDALGRDTDVSVADPAWFASYVALCAAVWLVLARSRRGGVPDLGFLVDALTVVVVSVLVFWRLAIGSILSQGDLSTTAKVVWSSYPVLDAVLLALVARALMSARARRSIGVTFAAGVVVWLLADTGPLVVSYVGWARIAIDTGWMVAPVLLALSVWRARPEGDRVPEEALATPGGWRTSLAIAVVPLLVPPALEIGGDVHLHQSHPVALGVGTTCLVALALVRTARLMRSEERHVRELVVARDSALEASHAKSLFVATMSHEIRTPLTTLVGAMDILEDTGLDEEQGFLVHRMARASTRLRLLVEDVLDFSAIEAGRLQLDPRPFDLHRVLDEMLDVYGPVATTRGLVLRWDRGSDVPADVVGDPVRLQQVLGNLLDNALKFTPSGAVGLDVTTDDAVQEVVFRVSDTGIGIPADRVEAVFESFTQADGSSSRPYEGSGLGLTIARRLAEAMGGTLAVHSEEGRGSTFEARLPLVGPSLRTPASAQPQGV